MLRCLDEKIIHATHVATILARDDGFRCGKDNDDNVAILALVFFLVIGIGSYNTLEALVRIDIGVLDAFQFLRGNISLESNLDIGLTGGLVLRKVYSLGIFCIIVCNVERSSINHPAE